MSEVKPESKVQEPQVPVTAPYMWGQGYCSDVYVEFVKVKKIKRLVILNAMVVPRRPMVIVSSPTDLENVKALVNSAERIESYIGHESTAKLLSDLLGTSVPVNRGEYIPEKGDIAVVVRLKRRLQAPQDLKDIKPEDLELHVVVYEEDRVIKPQSGGRTIKTSEKSS